MSSLLAEIVPMALAAAISPVVFLLMLNTLIGPRPIARGSAVAAGAAGVLVVVSSLGVALGATGFSTNDSLQAIVKVTFGGLLVAVGLRALLRPRKPKEKAHVSESISRSFLAGAAAMATNVTTLALYTPALAAIAGSGLALRQQGLASLVILLITLAVAWVPLLAAAVIPGATDSMLPALGRWMNDNDRWIQVVLGCGFGIWLLAAGAGQL